MKLPDFNPTLPQPPLEDAELDQLERLLAAVPRDAAMDLECLDGYLTGLLLGPSLPPSDAWLPTVWGGESPDDLPFPSHKQAKRVTVLVLRHLASIHRQLHDDVDALEPFFGIAETDGDQEWVDAQIWSLGCLQGLALSAPGALDDPALAEMLQPIALLGADELDAADAERIATPEQRDAWSRQVPDAVSELFHHWHAPAADSAASSAG